MAAARALPRRVRRPPLLGVGVPAAARRRPGDDVHDLVPMRFPDWVPPRTRRMHGAKYRTRRAHVRRGVRELGVHRPRRGGAARRVPRADPHRVSGRGRALPAGWAPRRPRPALRPHRRHRAPQERGHADRGAPDHGGRAGAGGRRRAPRSRRGETGCWGSATSRTTSSRASTAARTLFVYPSRFEGFGIPVVEAMASGVPCVVSSHPSLDEACGDAAVRVDPDSPRRSPRAIERALAERDALVARGLEHAARFTWGRPAGRSSRATRLHTEPRATWRSTSRRSRGRGPGRPGT